MVAPGTPTVHRVRELFFEAVEVPGSERPDFLHRHSGDLSSEARSELLALLHAHDSAGHFMAEPTLCDDTGPSRLAASLPAAETVVGPYRLIRRLGEGGFGTVYLAEQERPVRRQVALKLIKLGMDSVEVVRRFEAERQTLALMEHPNVARVFEAGMTDAGRPWFAMERVNGLPITVYARTKNITIGEKLELFLSVCHGVAHAHQRGIIHRDLKPANVLVAEHDNKPTPKVIDFGIAKALSGALVDLTVTIDQARGVGTPQYMSPEQAGGAGVMDVRADVYALGMILRELLTGLQPFPVAQLRAASPAERLRIVREQELPTLSRRLLEADPQEAQGSSAEDRARLARQLRGELEWMVARATEKEPARRYPSVEALTEDVQRYLANQPLRAGPITLKYRATKFLRRNRVVVSTTTVITLAILIGATLGLAGMIHARDERSERVRQEQLASARLLLAEERKTRAAAAEDAASYQAQLVASAQSSLSAMFQPLDDETDAQARSTVARLDALADRLDRRVIDPPDELAGPFEAILAFSYNAYNQLPQAEARARRAVAIHERLGRDYEDKLAGSLTLLATSIARQGRFDEADAHFVRAVEIMRRTDPVGGAGRLPDSLLNVAFNRFYLGRLAEARETVEEAVRATARSENPQEAANALLLSFSEVLRRGGEPELADDYARRAGRLPD